MILQRDLKPFGAILTALAMLFAPAITKAQGRFDARQLKDCVFGFMAITASGDTIALANEDLPMIPASTLKCITTGLALKELGPEYRFVTELSVRGKTDTLGALSGDIIITGSGDPTLASGQWAQTSPDTLFGKWTKAITNEGITSVLGCIVADESRFTREPSVPSWQLEDIGTYYGCGTSALTFACNTINIRFSPGTTEGDSVRILQLWPYTPWMRVSNKAKTSAAASGTSIDMETSSLMPYARFTGHMAINARPAVKQYANKYPALTCACAFNAHLYSLGLQSDDKAYYSTESLYDIRTGAPVRTICRTYSPPLNEIVRFTNTKSDNLCAEALFRKISLEGCGKSDYASATKYVTELLCAENIGKNEITIKDGSGLSRNNLITPSAMCRFLKMMHTQECFSQYLESLPYPGMKSSTVESLLKDIPRDKASKIRLKSGSMSGILCYAGYIKGSTEADTVIFCIMVNNSTRKISTVRKSLEEFIKSLL